MPEMTGFELYTRIIKIDKGITVCFITSFMVYYSSFFNESESACLIQKPISINDLVARVKEELEIC